MLQGGERIITMRQTRRGFTLVEVLIVVIIVGILSLAAMPLITNNTRDARRAEGEQMMGCARDYCRAEYSKTGNAADVTAGFTAQAASGNFTGEYFAVATYSETSSVAGMDASVQTNAAPDGTGTLDFSWESGKSQFTWTP
jgi:prepilin-type N-terminal cleavage/methylation domain-containing protein